MLTADHMYSLHNSEKFAQDVRMPSSQNSKTVSAIFIAFLQFG